MVSAARISGIFIMFFATFLFGLVPFALLRVFEKKLSKQSVKKWIGVLNCLNGGIFLGTATLHLLPEARELLMSCISLEYPVTEAITGCGFLMTLTLEHLVVYYGRGHHHVHDSKSEEDVTKSLNCENNCENREKENGTGEVNNENSELNERKNANENKRGEDSKVGEPLIGFLAFRSFLLLLALSFHMVFEGLAIGLQTDEGDAWLLLGVICLHKVVVAFSVGFQLKENLNQVRKAILSLFVLSVMTPIGIGIGYIVAETGKNGNGQDIASGILQSLSVGCFFYVTFLEILNDEICTTKDRSHCKVLFTAVGFGIMVGLQFVKGNHHHGH
jgi:zinc transporter 1/2/3